MGLGTVIIKQKYNNTILLEVSPPSHVVLGGDDDDSDPYNVQASPELGW